ncbi:MAG: 23S rRNA (adenine(2503)-C(2))-methyltransferase RlmN [Erysipelotrichaceae bacterium]|nr:23S rRNA (adenine(2503)-C(2))-methyltransferase RlmN [Erysipelotrichaceae bacterium]
MKKIYDYTIDELTEQFLDLGQKKFRAMQVFEWLYLKHANSFEVMSNINKELQSKLSDLYVIDFLKLKQKQVSKDGTVKYLFELSDGHLIETVLMRMDYGNSVCVTSQVGCNMACSFCASGLLKKQRNLSAGEMVAQVMFVQQELNQEFERVSHVVVMGTGEPFDNYEEVTKFIRIINTPKGLAIGARHITVSTCGLCDKIEEYAHFGLQTNLAISLHAPNDEKRSQIMPINKRYPMDQLRESIKKYIEITSRRVTFEYILLKGVNDSLVDARQLAHYVSGLNAYVNLIPYNSVGEHGFKQSDKATIDQFYSELTRLKVRATVRKEHGADIDGACGQLRAKHQG